MILVSACLLGVKCKYNGKDNYNEYLYNMWLNGNVMPVCPEVLGGLGIPRFQTEIIIENGKEILKNINGEDVTENFYSGAKKCLEIAKILNIKYAIMKSKSPSCSNDLVYDGTFSGKLIYGKGITVKLLENYGIKVFNENQILNYERMKKNDK